MKIEMIANRLKELGHPVRLQIIKALIKYGRDGLPVGALQQSINIPNSTLSHHLSKLVNAELLIQRREGRVLFCTVNIDNIESIASFLIDECCTLTK